MITTATTLGKGNSNYLKNTSNGLETVISKQQKRQI